MSAWCYMLRCADGSYYVGSARDDLERRVAEHNFGHYGGFTVSRRPVCLVWSQESDDVRDAIALERRIKGWSRAKKEALVAGDLDRLKLLSRRRRKTSSFETRPLAAPQDEAK